MGYHEYVHGAYYGLKYQASQKRYLVTVLAPGAAATPLASRVSRSERRRERARRGPALRSRIKDALGHCVTIFTLRVNYDRDIAS